MRRVGCGRSQSIVNIGGGWWRTIAWPSWACRFVCRDLRGRCLDLGDRSRDARLCCLGDTRDWRRRWRERRRLRPRRRRSRWRALLGRCRWRDILRRCLGTDILRCTSLGLVQAIARQVCCWHCRPLQRVLLAAVAAVGGRLFASVIGGRRAAALFCLCSAGRSTRGQRRLWQARVGHGDLLEAWLVGAVHGRRAV